MGRGKVEKLKTIKTMTKEELKRQLKIGRELKLVFKFKKLDKPLKRIVRKVQTNGVWFEREEKPDKLSFLELGKASLIEADAKGFRIYEAGKRDLTEEEKVILSNLPTRQKTEEMRKIIEEDLMQDMSRGYWMDKDYTEKHKIPWYWKPARGLYYLRGENKMRDDKIKGKLELEYKFEK